MKEFIFFDLDGTLTDSEEGIFNSLKISLSLFNIEKTDEQMMEFIGPPLEESFLKIMNFSPSQTEKAVSAFHKYYEEKGLFENRVYDGIPNLLERLKNSGKHLAVSTSKPEHSAVRILEHFNLSHYFDFICGSSIEENRSSKSEVIAYTMKKFNLSQKDSDRIIMVGDRRNDIEGSHKNGIQTVSVLYGYGSIKEFKDSGADFIVETVETLENFLLSI